MEITRTGTLFILPRNWVNPRKTVIAYICFMYSYWQTANNAKLQNVNREFYLREPDGNEIGVFGYDDALVKFYNLSASGNFGRIEVDTTHQHVIDPLGELVTNVLRNDTRYYYIKDHLGSVRLTIDEDGNTVSAQDYSPFGRIIRSYNAGEDSDYYKFTEKKSVTKKRVMIILVQGIIIAVLVFGIVLTSW